MRIEIQGYDLPGRVFEPDGRNVHVGIQRGKDVIETFPGDAEAASWSFDCDVVEGAGGIDLRGPYIQGRPGDRFVYLSWGDVNDRGDFAMFRRAKLMVGAIDQALLQAAHDGKRLVGKLGLTDRKGGPLCAAVRPPAIEWSVQ
jgi:hypothetical protein